MNWTKKITLGLALTSILATVGCKRAIVRDPETYKAEVAFLSMGLEQNTELLEEHLADGTCVCVDGEWESVVCEDTALNILVVRNRLDWHVAMMLYLGNLSDVRPPEEPPEVPEPSTLCPAEEE